MASFFLAAVLGASATSITVYLMRRPQAVAKGPSKMMEQLMDAADAAEGREPQA